MKTIGDKITPFAVTGVKPGALTPEGAFETITETIRIFIYSVRSTGKL
jgi:hypothetical protein